MNWARKNCLRRLSSFFARIPNVLPCSLRCCNSGAGRRFLRAGDAIPIPAQYTFSKPTVSAYHIGPPRYRRETVAIHINDVDVRGAQRVAFLSRIRAPSLTRA